MEDAPVRPGDVLAGKLEVERVLGEGGMGVVVAARHLELEQRVAVKFLLPEIAKRPDAAERFRREARAAAKIRSEHVARVLDVGSSADGVPYMVMEYLEGNDLADELRDRGALPVEEAVGFVLEASEAVAEAHAAGIVHRDLKPANLFLARRADGSRLVKVLDFGISKSVSGGSSADLSLTATSTMIGSPLYMSPEQMHSAKSVDVRTDIWSLGAILYQLLTSRPPFPAESIPQLCNALLNDSPAPLSGFRDDVPPELEAAVLRALAKDRAERWQSVGEMCQALATFAPSARVHADRAMRVLSTAGGSGGAAPSPARTEPGSPGTEDIAQQATMPSSPAARGERTLDSWGKTGSQSAPAPRTRSRSWMALAGGVAVALGLVAWGISRTTATATPSAAPVVDTAAPPAPEVAPAEMTAPATPAPTVEVAPANELGGAPSASASAGPAAATARRVAPALPAPARTKPTAPAPASTSKPPAAPFGGRE
jgi:serine/threonine-protein kinase